MKCLRIVMQWLNLLKLWILNDLKAYVEKHLLKLLFMLEIENVQCLKNMSM